MIKELYITLTTQDNEVKESLDKLLIQLEAQKWIKINSCREERLSWSQLPKFFWGFTSDLEIELSKPKYIYLISICDLNFFKINKRYKWPITLEKRFVALFEISKSIINDQYDIISERLNYNGNTHKIQIVDIDYLSCYI
ncbi:MAG: hypothetical protein NT139_01665 [Candidatus Woesearchaeota archaeon]|nr:hypothetical protein [Candidatus Woesearchaeota archaeon]